MNISDYISLPARAKIADAIASSDNNEVFFLGITDDAKLVIDVEIIARGNIFSTPAILRNLSPGDAVIHNHPSGNLTPSDADTNIASHIGQFGIASYIVDNNVERIYAVVEPSAKEKLKKLNIDELKNMFDKGGGLQSALDYFEYRPQQIKMTAAVAEAFNNDKIAIIEAGTGTGKTLSYLLPAIIWATQNKEKCIVATNTINLQEQLVNKDLPLIKKILPIEFKYILVKGKNNYVCMNKFYKIYQQPDMFDIDKHIEQLTEIRDWLNITDDGSKSGLNFIPDFGSGNPFALKPTIV